MNVECGVRNALESKTETPVGEECRANLSGSHSLNNNLRTVLLLLLTLFLVLNLPAEGAEKPLKVIVCAGQSNMVGKRGDASQLPAELKGEQKSLFWTGKEWVPLKPGVTEKKGFGPEISCAYKAAEILGEPVGIIKHSVGGTSLHTQWNVANPKSLYSQLLAKVQSAQKSRKIDIIGMIWMQGERDSKDKTMAENYAKNLEALVNKARKDFNSPEMFFAAGRVNPPKGKYTFSDIVRKAQEECSLPGYAFIDCDPLPKGGDNLHYTTEGLVRMGNLFAAALTGGNRAVTEGTSPRPLTVPAGEKLKVFVLIGQSNMVGKRCLEKDLPAELKNAQENVLFFDGKKWVPIKPGVTERKGYGPELSFGNVISGKLGGPIGIIKHSVGGTSLYKDWNPKDKRSLYAQLVKKVEDGAEQQPLEVAGVLWIQGGADSKEKGPADAYAENLSAFIQTMRKEFHSPDMAWVTGRSNAVRFPFNKPVRTAQMECREARYTWVDMDDIELGPDKLHYTGKGMVEVGKRCAEAMYRLLEKAGTNRK